MSLPASPTGEPVTTSGHTDSWTATTLLTAHRTADDTLTYTPGPLTARTRGRKPPAHAARILIFLAAAAGRHPHVHGWLHTLLTTDPALAVHAGGTALTTVAGYTSPALAETIHGLLPAHSLDLDPAAAVLAQHLLDHNDRSDEQRARHSSVLAIRLANTGRRQQALAPAEEAVTIYRRLVEANPDAYLPDLAMSLNNLGTLLSELGRREQALAPAEEAVTIRRRLVEANPDAYLPNLASLLAYGLVCVNLQANYAEALESVTEAISLYEPLVRQLPQMFAGQRFSANRTLADVLDGLGRTEEAAELRQQLDEAPGGGPSTQ